MKIIDPHLHLFNLAQGDYHWLKADSEPFWPDKSLINKTYTVNDLTLTAPLKLAAFVHIEAGFDNNQPWRELASLEHNCNKSFMAIANIDLTQASDAFEQCLSKLTEYRSFVGIRHILDEQAFNLLTDEQVLSNFKILNSFASNTHQRFVFETQLSLTEDAPVNALCEVIRENSDISFIIDHAGFPPIDTHVLKWQRWQRNLVKLSTLSNVAIKCSGWEMTDRSYKTNWLNDNLNTLLKAFGPKKLMLASNFPLCLFSKSSYQIYWESIFNGNFFQSLTEQEKSALCYDNALRWYSLKL